MELVPSGKLNDRGEEYFLLADAMHQTGNERFAYVERNHQWHRSRYLPVNRPIMTNPSTVVKEADPYRNVWNAHGEYYGEELSKNGFLFMPTYFELAQRSISVSRYYLRKARNLNEQGQHTAAKEIFQEALSHRRIAQGLLSKHLEVMSNSR